MTGTEVEQRVDDWKGKAHAARHNRDAEWGSSVSLEVFAGKPAKAIADDRKHFAAERQLD